MSILSCPTQEYEIFISLTPENILGIDILLGQILKVSISEVHPRASDQTSAEGKHQLDTGKAATLMMNGNCQTVQIV